MRDAEYFDRFFEEKDLPYVTWEIETPMNVHHLSNKVVIEHIKCAPPREAKEIRAMLTRLDFHNADINHYLAHLAKCLVATMERQALADFAAEAALN